MTVRAALAIGPINTAGQAFHWSNAVQRELGISAWSYAGTRRPSRRVNGPSHHRVMHPRVPPRAVRQAQLRRLLSTRTHLLVESTMAIFGDPRTSFFTDELPRLREAGLVVGGINHGSDVRSPSAHMQRVENSLYRLYDAPSREALEETAQKRRNALASNDIPCFVSTPDLLFDLPDAVWVPLVIDVEAWGGEAPALTRQRPTILHVPSRRDPPIKGTHLIDPALLELDRQGVIDYVSPHSPLGRQEMLSLVQSADVVVDQLMIDSYGVAAVEGMAAGRLVLGHVGARTRSLMPDDPPILDVTPESLVSVITDIARDPKRFRGLAAHGVDYARQTHGGSLSARALEPFLATAHTS